MMKSGGENDMRKLLVVVDMQKDFIDGALGTEEAVKIVGPAAEKIRKAKEQGTDIVFTKDTHHKDYLMTQEGRKLPVPHCVKGTEGWELDSSLKSWRRDAGFWKSPLLAVWNWPGSPEKKNMRRLS